MTTAASGRDGLAHQRCEADAGDEDHGEGEEDVGERHDLRLPPDEERELLRRGERRVGAARGEGAA